jgi:basic membrane protein A
VRGGLKDGFVKMSAYGPRRDRPRPRKKADDIKGKMMAGSSTSSRAAQGQQGQGRSSPAGKTFKQTDLELEKMNYLVEGVIGSI